MASIGASTSDVCLSSYEALLFKLAFYLSFFGALQVSELLPHKLGGCSGILFDDVLLKLDSAHILLRQSKADPLRCGGWITLRRNLGS